MPSAHLREVQNDPQMGSETSRWYCCAVCPFHVHLQELQTIPSLKAQRSVPHTLAERPSGFIAIRADPFASS